MLLTIDLLRHGEAEGGGIYRGITDTPLTEKGRQQMSRSVAASDQHQWQAIWHSPLQRCADFAAELGQQLGIPVAVDKRLQEIDFGLWDGLGIEQVMQQYPQQSAAFWEDPRLNPPPGGESTDQLQARVFECLEALFKQALAEAEDQHLLLVTHGGVIRGIIAGILEIPPGRWSSLALDHASVSRIQLGEYDGQRWRNVCFVNSSSA